MASGSENVDALYGTDYFRDLIAERLHPILQQATKQQLFDMIELPNNADNGDLALPMPKLNKVYKVGNPAQAAAAAAAAVRALATGVVALISLCAHGSSRWTT